MRRRGRSLPPGSRRRGSSRAVPLVNALPDLREWQPVRLLTELLELLVRDRGPEAGRQLPLRHRFGPANLFAVRPPEEDGPGGRGQFREQGGVRNDDGGNGGHGTASGRWDGAMVPC